jgi:hypothetical protein
MPTTPKRHFDEDIARATSIVAHASPLPSTTLAGQLLRDDLLRSAWMFGVGAMDAYFSDAYVHMLTTALRAKNGHTMGADGCGRLECTFRSDRAA